MNEENVHNIDPIKYPMDGNNLNTYINNIKENGPINNHYEIPINQLNNYNQEQTQEDSTIQNNTISDNPLIPAERGYYEEDEEESFSEEVKKKQIYFLMKKMFQPLNYIVIYQNHLKYF